MPSGKIPAPQGIYEPDFRRKKNEPAPNNPAAPKPAPRKSMPGTNCFSKTSTSSSVTGSFTLCGTDVLVQPTFGPPKNQTAKTTKASSIAATRNFVRMVDRITIFYVPANFS